MTTNIDPRNNYELMENDAGEIMLLLYANSTKPTNSICYINEETKSLELKRNKDDIVIFNNLQSESIIKINSQKTLYVCEMKFVEEQNQETEILYAYASQLKKKVF